MGFNILNILKNQHSIELNDQQKAAVNHNNGPAVILAVPGAGKTTVLIARTANLILKHGVNPGSILSVTFSKAAAIDMRNRFQLLFGDMIPGGMGFSTIHSFAYFVLREYSNYTGKRYTVIEGENSGITKASILKRLYFNANNTYINDDKLEDLISNISFVKNMMLEEKDFKKYDFNIDGFYDIYCAYEKNKKANNLIDFDDMLTICYDILEGDKRLLDKYRNKYEYVQVDEGQDTSRIQHEIIKLVTKPKNNIFLVGDEDQSIYGFRGAYPEAILNFENEYGSARVFFMEENFRSTKQIVFSANELIKANKERYEKNMFTNMEEGNPINIKILGDEQQQMNYLIKGLSNSKALKNSAVLYRNNMSAISLADAFERNDIPFYLRDFKLSFFNHWVVSDIVSALNLSLFNDNIEAFERIYYKINSYISKKAVEYIKKYGSGESVFDMLKAYPGLNSYQIRRMDILKDNFIYLSGKRPKSAIEYIERELSYKEYLRENCDKLGYSYENLNIILGNLKLIAHNSKVIEDFLNRLEDLRSIMENAGQNKGKNAVTLSTIHSCKGLEFENVYLVDLIEGQFPTSASIEAAKDEQPEEIEEERRLFYVGITRARKKLNLLSVNRKNDEGVVCSRFLGEIYSVINPIDESIQEEQETYEVREGNIISHKAFGKGKVTKIERNTVDVDFDVFGTKKLLLEACIENNLIMVLE